MPGILAVTKNSTRQNFNKYYLRVYYERNVMNQLSES